MKSLVILSFFAASFTVNAHELEKYEPVLVSELTQVVNLMPPVEPDRKIQTQMKVNVQSSGCTKAEDFAVNMKMGMGSQFVEIKRLRRDPCRAMIHTIQVDLRTDSLLLADRSPLNIVNPSLAEVKYIH